MIRKSFFFIFLLVLISQVVTANWRFKADSLKTLITHTSSDSVQVILHTEIVDLLFLNKPEEAYKHIIEVISIAERNADTNLIHKAYIDLGDYFSFMNDYQSALKFIYKAFDLSRNNESLLAKANSSLSEVFYFLEDLDKSIHHARISLNLNQQLNDTAQIIYNLHDIGMWHMEMKEYDSAIYYLQLSKVYDNLLNNEDNTYITSHLGVLYEELNLYDSALYYHFEALKMDSINNSEYEIAIDEYYIGNTYFLKKDYEKAKLYANKSMKRSKELNLLDAILYNYELLYKVAEKEADFEQALEYALLRNNYADSLREKNKQSIIQGLNAKYSFDEQQQKLQSQRAENRLLKKQKTLLISLIILSMLFLVSTVYIIIQILKKHKANKLMLAELEEANNAKERMISIISHDLRGSIGTMRNSVKYITNNALNFDTTKRLLQNFFPVVDSTYDLLDNLLIWANYSKENLDPAIEELHITPIINKSIEHTSHFAQSKQIEIINKVDDTIVSADKNMLSTIIRNLLSNAVKFSYPNSKVTIESIITNNNIAEITIKDEGIGIKSNVLINIFNSPTDYHSKGTHGERGSGLGLSMCKTFVEKQGGTIKADSKLGEGSCFSFTIPVIQKN